MVGNQTQQYLQYSTTTYRLGACSSKSATKKLSTRSTISPINYPHSNVISYNWTLSFGFSDSSAIGVSSPRSCRVPSHRCQTGCFYYSILCRIRGQSIPRQGWPDTPNRQDGCVLGQISRVGKSSDTVLSLPNLELTDDECLYIRSFPISTILFLI